MKSNSKGRQREKFARAFFFLEIAAQLSLFAAAVLLHLQTDEGRRKTGQWKGFET